MTISDALDYTASKLFGWIGAQEFSKREENKANKVIDILLDMMNGKKIPKKR